jgi:hypothetical protein
LTAQSAVLKSRGGASPSPTLERRFPSAFQTPSQGFATAGASGMSASAVAIIVLIGS